MRVIESEFRGVYFEMNGKKKEYTAVTGGEHSRKRHYRSVSELDNDAVESSMDTV